MQFRNFIASLALASTVLATPIDLSRRDEGGCPGFKQVVQTVWEKNSEQAASATNAKNSPATVGGSAPSVAASANGNTDSSSSTSEQDTETNHQHAASSSSQQNSQSGSQSGSQSNSGSSNSGFESDESKSRVRSFASSGNLQSRTTSVSASAASSTVLHTTTINGSPSVITSVVLETKFITLTLTPNQTASSTARVQAGAVTQQAAESADLSVTTQTIVQTEVINLPVFASPSTPGGSSILVSTQPTTRPVTRTRTETVTVTNTPSGQKKADAASTIVVSKTTVLTQHVTTTVQGPSNKPVVTTLNTVLTKTILSTADAAKAFGSGFASGSGTPSGGSIFVASTADAVAGAASKSSKTASPRSAAGYGSNPKGSSNDGPDSSDDSKDSASTAAASTSVATLTIDNKLTVTQSLGAITTQGPTTAASASTMTSDAFTTLPTEVAATLAAAPTGQVHRDINDPEYQAAWVRAHNEKRALHQVGEVRWSDDLAKSALIIGENCIFQHNQTVGGGGYGQNINAVTGANDSPQAAVNSWFGEESKFNEYGVASPTGDFHSWGHFTQVVWKDSTEIGCATVTCKDGLALAFPDAESDLTVCNYRVAGNVFGFFDKNVFPRK